MPDQIKPPRYIYGFDYLRVLAVFSVVWIHGCDPNRLARSFQTITAFAVPCFIMVAIYLTLENIANQKFTSFGTLIKRRIVRLIPAYLVWSGAYLLARLFKHRVLSSTEFNIDWLSVLAFGGASYQLWFVPALLIWTILFFPVFLGGPPRKPFAWIFWVGIGLFILWAGPEIRAAVHIPAGYEMIIHMLGGTGYVFVGIGIWQIINQSGNGDGSQQYARLGMLFGFMVALAGRLVLYFKIGAGFYIPLYSTGLFIFLGFLPLTNVNEWIKKLSGASYGVYLCHGLFVEGYQLVAGRVGLDLSEFSVTLSVILFAYFSSMILCLLMRKRFAWLVV